MKNIILYVDISALVWYNTEEFGRGAFCNQYPADIIAETTVMLWRKGAGAEDGYVKNRSGKVK